MAGVPLYRLSKQWGINRESLRNHKANHISPAATALHIARDPGGSKVLDEVEELRVEAWKMYGAARAVRNMPLAIKAVNELRSLAELKARLTGELDERPVVAINIQSSPVWVAIRSTVFEVLEPHPQLRAEISRRLRVLADSSENEVS